MPKHPSARWRPQQDRELLQKAVCREMIAITNLQKMGIFALLKSQIT